MANRNFNVHITFILIASLLILPAAGLRDYSISLGRGFNYTYCNAYQRLIEKADVGTAGPDICYYAYDENYIVAKEFDENKKSYHYWIIFKLADVFVGPLEYENYIDICRINNIPFDLYKYLEPINQKDFFIKGPIVFQSPSEAYINLGSNFILDNNRIYNTKSHKIGNITFACEEMIDYDVVEYYNDESFIVVKQNYNSRNNYDPEDGKLYYWIVDKKEFKMLGHLDTIDEFIIQ